MSLRRCFSRIESNGGKHETELKEGKVGADTVSFVETKNVPHIWHVDSGIHDFNVWRNDLYLLTQLVFR